MSGVNYRQRHRAQSDWGYIQQSKANGIYLPAPQIAPDSTRKGDSGRVSARGRVQVRMESARLLLAVQIPRRSASAPSVPVLCPQLTFCRYLRALAAMYIRMTFRAVEVYELLEPLLKDYRKLRRLSMCKF